MEGKDIKLFIYYLHLPIRVVHILGLDHIQCIHHYVYVNIPHSLDGRATACNSGDLGSIPGSGRPPGEGNGNPLQYACLGNPMDRGAWWAIVHGVAESDTTEQPIHTQIIFSVYIVQLSPVTQPCLTLCDPMNYSTPGLPVHHQPPELTQTHVQ